MIFLFGSLLSREIFILFKLLSILTLFFCFVELFRFRLNASKWTTLFRICSDFPRSLDRFHCDFIFRNSSYIIRSYLPFGIFLKVFEFFTGSKSWFFWSGRRNFMLKFEGSLILELLIPITQDRVLEKTVHFRLQTTFLYSFQCNKATLHFRKIVPNRRFSIHGIRSTRTNF